MKIVIAPDSFKESMTAQEAAKALERGVHCYDKTIKTILCPLADGGEGTLDTLVLALQGEKVEYEVTGPLFNKIMAPIGYVDDMAIIECAKVCGLELLDETQKDPSQTTSYGLGELIVHAVEHQVSKIMICLGGSATNDGGIGMLAALGVQFLDESHHVVSYTMEGLKDICNICLDNLNQRLKDIEWIGVCDVINPLCGNNGATYIYGPQKGLSQAKLESIDQAMFQYAQKVDFMFQKDYMIQPGAGAAGGLGYAMLAFLKAKLRSGFEIVSETIHLEEAILHCDKVIVGEGKLDKQTQFGKTPYGVLQIAQKYHKDVYAFAGKIEDVDVLKQLGFKSVYTITPHYMPLSIALKKGQENLEKTIFEHMEEIINEI